MPTRRNTWSSWNYLTSSGGPSNPYPVNVSLTYNMNILQHIPVDTFGHVLVTMNPPHEPDESTVQGKFTYEHPLYTQAAMRALERLELLQNKRGVSFCGAWTKYGFHEDGFSSGLRVALRHLGGKIPFDFVDATYSRGYAPEFSLLDALAQRAVMLVTKGCWLVEGILKFPFLCLAAVILYCPLVGLIVGEFLTVVVGFLHRVSAKF